MLLYIGFNSVRVLSYIPQIFVVMKDKQGAKAISLITWSFWTGANLTTALYATIIAPDAWLAGMSYGNTLGCLIVVVMVVYKRWKLSNDFIILDESTDLSLSVSPSLSNNVNNTNTNTDFKISDKNM